MSEKIYLFFSRNIQGIRETRAWNKKQRAEREKYRTLTLSHMIKFNRENTCLLGNRERVKMDRINIDRLRPF